MSGGELTPHRAGAASRGFALLVVLWVLSIFALLGIMVGATGRTEARIARNLVIAAQSEAAIDGALEEAAFRVLAAGPRFAQTGLPPWRIEIGDLAVDVRVEDQNGRINPNEASPDLLLALFGAAGISKTEAVALTQALLDWRGGEGAEAATAAAERYRNAGAKVLPPGTPLRTLDEIGLIAGFTPQITRRIVPHLTLAHHGMPSLDQAGPVVRRALQSLPLDTAVNDASPTPTIVIDVATGSIHRRVSMRVDCGPGAPSCLRIADWVRVP